MRFLLVKDAISQLSSNRKATKCKEMVAVLESLGFTVRAGKAPNHKIYIHSNIVGFHSSSFSCEHGKENQCVKPNYVTKVLGVLKMYQTDLEALEAPKLNQHSKNDDEFESNIGTGTEGLKND